MPGTDADRLRRYRKDYTVRGGVRDSRDRRIHEAVRKAKPLVLEAIRKRSDGLTLPGITKKLHMERDIARRCLVVLRNEGLVVEEVCDCPGGELPPGSITERRYRATGR